MKILDELGAKPSISEEHGLSLLKDEDLVIFSPGISTAGFAEIRMAQQYPQRKIIATTIDIEGLDFARQVITEVGLDNQIETRLENLSQEWNYPVNYFDFIYARLVLHYLSKQDLEKVLSNFARSLKTNGRIFVVVRSEKNVDRSNLEIKYDSVSKLTSIPEYHSNGNFKGMHIRYFHSSETIRLHLENAGFKVTSLIEYQEQLYRDFMRKEISPVKDHVIEVVASKM